jgi:hypothetical protein
MKTSNKQCEGNVFFRDVASTKQMKNTKNIGERTTQCECGRSSSQRARDGSATTGVPGCCCGAKQKKK